MSEIPADVMKAAQEAMATLPKAFGWMKASEACARAIMAERDRAAKVAHGWMHDNGLGANAASVAIEILKGNQP